MGAVLDLFRVLFSPTEVFERVREKPKFLVPALAISVIAIVLNYFMLPYRTAAMASRMAQIAQQNPGAAAQAAKFQIVGLAFVPIVVFVLLLIVAGILWLLVTLLAGGDGKYRTLLSVTTYTALPGILLQVAGLAVLMMKGVESVTLDPGPAAAARVEPACTERRAGSWGVSWRGSIPSRCGAWS